MPCHNFTCCVFYYALTCIVCSVLLWPYVELTLAAQLPFENLYQIIVEMCFLGPFYWHGLIDIRVWMNNYIDDFMSHGVHIHALISTWFNVTVDVGLANLCWLEISHGTDVSSQQRPAPYTGPKLPIASWSCTFTQCLNLSAHKHQLFKAMSFRSTFAIISGQCVGRVMLIPFCLFIQEKTGLHLLHWDAITRFVCVHHTCVYIQKDADTTTIFFWYCLPISKI